MDKTKLTNLFDNYKIRVIINAKQSGVVLCNASSTTHIYFVAQNVNSLLSDIDSFTVRDITNNDNSAKIICEYDKEKDCLAFLDSIQYRKVILKIVNDLGIDIAIKVINVLNERNIRIDDDLFLDVLSLNTVFDFLVNAPLGHKPSEDDSVRSITKLDNNIYQIERNTGVSSYSISVDNRTKAERQSNKSDSSWYQLGFVIKEV